MRLYHVSYRSKNWEDNVEKEPCVYAETDEFDFVLSDSDEEEIKCEYEEYTDYPENTRVDDVTDEYPIDTLKLFKTLEFAGYGFAEIQVILASLMTCYDNTIGDDTI